MTMCISFEQGNMSVLLRGFLSAFLTLTTRLAVTLSLGLLDLMSSDAGQILKVQGLEQILGLKINLDGRGIQSRDLRDVVILALSLLLLKLEGDATNGTALNTLHQMSGEASNLVAQTL